MRRYLITCLVFVAAVASCSATHYRGLVIKPAQAVEVVPSKTLETPKMKIVAVIDTGLLDIILKQGYRAGICKFGHKDFTGQGLNDIHGHGTNISGLIDHYAHGVNYCQVIIKYYDKDANHYDSAHRFIAAIRYAIALHVDYINISGGGVAPLPEERDLINKAIKEGIVIISAAGNERADIDIRHYYPAYYNDKIYVIGNGTDEDHHAKTSNYGKRIDAWRNGEDQTAYGTTFTGTSQSTAIFTGQLIKQDSEE